MDFDEISRFDGADIEDVVDPGADSIEFDILCGRHMGFVVDKIKEAKGALKDRLLLKHPWKNRILGKVAFKNRVVWANEVMTFDPLIIYIQVFN